MINEIGIKEFENLTESLTFYTKLLLEKDKIISKNTKNKETYKKEIIELHPIFFKLKNPKKVIFDLQNYDCLPYWVVLEILTEMLGKNPPMMINYRKDIIDWSYDLLCSGKACYSYGERWKNYNSLEKTYERLLKNPTSKRCYVPIFDQNDVGDTKDCPCNIGFSLLIRDNKLDLTLFTRSIDIMKGYRYDFSLFSFIQQCLASFLDVEVGDFYYYCNSLHCYGVDIDKLKHLKQHLICNKNDNLELEIDTNMDITKCYDDLRNIVEFENVIRHGNMFDEKNIDKLNYKFSRDFLKILMIKNGIDIKIDSMETSCKSWFAYE